MITENQLRVLRAKFEPVRRGKQSDYREYEEIRQKFASRFPPSRIPLLTLDEYVVGKRNKDGEINKDSFCYWVEYETDKLGRIKPFPASFGVFCDQKTQRYKFKKVFKNEYDALKYQREQIVRLLEAGRANDLKAIDQIDISQTFKGKILFLYYPENYLNIFSERYIDDFLSEIPLTVPNGNPGVFKKGELLLTFKSDDEIMSKWTMYEFTDFLYVAWGNPKTRLEDSRLADIKAIISNPTADPTTMQAQVTVRLGQGEFGSKVRELWNHRCAVTGSSTMAALEASHIKPWADSTDDERLDPNNGLLLTANLHRLFDAGLISFEDSGKILVSSKLSQSEREIFGVVGKKLSKKPSVETANYLAYHRTKVFGMSLSLDPCSSVSIRG
jgi:hypothetical protein